MYTVHSFWALSSITGTGKSVNRWSAITYCKLKFLLALFSGFTLQFSVSDLRSGVESLVV